MINGINFESAFLEGKSHAILYKHTLALALSVFAGGSHADKTVLTVAAYPAVDQIVKDSLVVWSKNHPDVEVKVVGREYSPTITLR